ncbi:MAG: hypothetical protein KC502_05735 [Myxococcales bacterium]|nr:hypothetical protein [Myxococcales bacterium]
MRHSLVSSPAQPNRRFFFTFTALLLGSIFVALACVPPRPPPPRPSEAQVAARKAKQAKLAKSRENTMASDPNAKRKDGLKGGKLVFSDDFERDKLGSDWKVNHAGEWVVSGGQLKANRVGIYGDRNKGVWLLRQLPKKTRIEFEGQVRSGKGDIKCESFAKKPVHEAGYSFIFGGWGNTINTITRLGEHEPNRVVQRPHVPVQTSKTYKWAIVRTDHAVRWYVDGKFMASYDDKQPVYGPYFGFNNWLSDVRFDNIKVYEL